MAEVKKSQKLSLRPGVQKTPVKDEAAAWVVRGLAVLICSICVCFI